MSAEVCRHVCVICGGCDICCSGIHGDPPEYEHETEDQARADIERDEAGQ
jgi:hypothetical protein